MTAYPIGTTVKALGELRDYGDASEAPTVAAGTRGVTVDQGISRTTRNMPRVRFDCGTVMVVEIGSDVVAA